MTKHDKRIINDLLAIGVVGTLVSLPLGLWAIPRYRDELWKATAILTGAGFLVKHLMMHGESHD